VRPAALFEGRYPPVVKRAFLCYAIALVFAASAAGHEGPGPALPGFKATVKGLKPGTRGVTLKVLGGEDQLWLLNRSGKTITIIGYEGEPYLRFTPRGIYQNRNSPATYLNADRFARAVVPRSAHAGAKPVWRRLAKSRAWAWHDHRIHWMSTFPPKEVVEDRQTPRHIFDWSVPALLESKRIAILGSLDYSPPPNP
jgi:hypothetical protein